MYVTVVTCKQKLKQCFYKLIYIKITVNVQQNQANNIRRNKKMKSGKKAKNNMIYIFFSPNIQSVIKILLLYHDKNDDIFHAIFKQQLV